MARFIALLSDLEREDLYQAEEACKHRMENAQTLADYNYVLAKEGLSSIPLDNALS